MDTEDFNYPVNNLDLMELYRFLCPAGREYVFFKHIMTTY